MKSNKNLIFLGALLLTLPTTDICKAPHPCGAPTIEEVSASFSGARAELARNFEGQLALAQAAAATANARAAEATRASSALQRERADAIQQYRDATNAMQRAMLDMQRDFPAKLAAALADSKKDEAKDQSQAQAEAFRQALFDAERDRLTQKIPVTLDGKKQELTLAELQTKRFFEGGGKELFKEALKSAGTGTKAVVTDIGSFVTSKRFPQFINENRMPLLKVALGIGGVVVGVYAAKKGIELGADKVRYIWKNPGLIEDCDVVPLVRFWEQRKDVGTLDEVEGAKNFKNELFDWVRTLKESRGTGRGSVAMLFGKPGTGKTFSAKRVARAAGLRYAVIKGNVIADCENPISELDKKIKWAKENKILLVVDEADALICRGIDASDSKAYRILNHFISITGDPDDRPNMVLITNKPELIDPRFTADGGRVDTAIMFPELSLDGISNILKRNIEKWALKKKVVVSVDFAKAAKGTPGKCPGRDLEALACKSVISASFDGEELTTERLDQAAKRHLHTKKMMREFSMEKATPAAAAAA